MILVVPMPSDFMASAVKKPGVFKAAAAKVGESTMSYAHEKKSAPGVLGKRARLAMTFAKFRPKGASK